MASKLKLKLGQIEVEYEGEEQFLKSELPALLRAVAELQKSAQDLEGDGSAPADGKLPGGGEEKSGGAKLQLSTTSIATKLGCKSGPDLLYASCAHLALVKGMASYTRKDILKEAKSATSFYNQSVRANLSNHLNSLIKGDKLNETAQDVYALTSARLSEIKAKLGLDN